MSKVKHYIKSGNTVYDLESDFDGLLYARCSGLYEKGKRKNIYVEKFAENKKENVWFGDNVTRDSTKIKMSLYFTGENRHKVYEYFYDVVKNGECEYWDTKRLKKAFFYLESAYSTKTDSYTGNVPYIECEFDFNNLYGMCFDCTNDGTIIDKDYE